MSVATHCVHTYRGDVLVREVRRDDAPNRHMLTATVVRDDRQNVSNLFEPGRTVWAAERQFAAIAG